MSLRSVTVACTVVISLGLLATALFVHSAPLLAVALVLCAAPLLLAVALNRPEIFCWVFGLILGAAPFATIPSTGFYASLALVPVIFVVALLHRAPQVADRRMLIWLIVYMAVSLVSALATMTSISSATAYLRWVLAMLAGVIYLFMMDRLRSAIVRSFSIGVAAGLTLAVVLALVDSGGRFVSSLGIIGYSSEFIVVRTVAIGAESFVRVTGLYVDPNSAGLFGLMGLAAAAVAWRGTVRIVVMGVIAAATALTLSRSAIGALVVAALLLLFVRRQSAGSRVLVVFFGAALAGLALLIPSISARLLSSFGRGDLGTSDRQDALQRFPGQLEGRWWFGRGWSLREFEDPVYGYFINHVANTPLLVVYRGGIFAGIVFLGILILALVYCLRLLRRGPIGAAMLGATTFGLIVVALQLDFPVVTMPPLALAFALVIAILATEQSRELRVAALRGSDERRPVGAVVVWG